MNEREVLHWYAVHLNKGHDIRMRPSMGLEMLRGKHDEIHRTGNPSHNHKERGLPQVYTQTEAPETE